MLNLITVVSENFEYKKVDTRLRKSIITYCQKLQYYPSLKKHLSSKKNCPYKKAIKNRVPIMNRKEEEGHTWIPTFWDSLFFELFKNKL